MATQYKKNQEKYYKDDNKQMYDHAEKQFQVKIDELIKQMIQYSKGHLENVNYMILPKVFDEVKKIINEQPIFLDLFAPIKVVGSLYGHFQGLIKLFQFVGWPSDVSYLFLGNYVDKGPQSFQTIILLLLYKLKYPRTFFLLRGCHEIAYINTLYGFYDQCKDKGHIQFWKKIIQIFNVLPYAAIIDQKIFCASGGIGPELKSIKQIQKFSKGIQFPSDGIIGDLLWSDPCEDSYGFEVNIQGYGTVFGRDSFQRFVDFNNIQLMIRSKHVIEEGYCFIFDKKLLNIFSAPNFMNKFQNSAAILSITTDLFCQLQIYKPKKNKSASYDLI